MKHYDIMIVGGGSAGWMTAATLLKEFPHKKIALIESPDIETVGVGESTLGQIRYWTNWMGIKDEDLLPATDGTYKLSIKFTDFYKKGESFHYPFGVPATEETSNGLNDWWCKKALAPDTPVSDYVDCFYPQSHLLHSNKLTYNEHNQIENWDFFKFSAFHFDATKFGLWLAETFCKPSASFSHFTEEITEISRENEDGSISSLNNRYSADLYIDCTGFSSLLLGKTLGVPFESFPRDLLPNNSAWATKIPYENKSEQLVNFTDCTAIENGWVWTIPLWNRIGAGYVYSDQFIDSDTALSQFQKHIGTKELDFKQIKMRTGIHERLWEKNVVAIGLSAGFIEPLESTGLFTVHEFLRELIRELHRDRISQWERDNFTYRCKDLFNKFVGFVALHFSLSHRNDSEYWKTITEQSHMRNEENPFAQEYFRLADARYIHHNYENQLGGLHCIATGMHLSPMEMSELTWLSYENVDYFEKEWKTAITFLDDRKKKWEMNCRNSKKTINFLKEKVYGT